MGRSTTRCEGGHENRSTTSSTSSTSSWKRRASPKSRMALVSFRRWEEDTPVAKQNTLIFDFYLSTTSGEMDVQLLQFFHYTRQAFSWGRHVLISNIRFISAIPSLVSISSSNCTHLWVALHAMIFKITWFREENKAGALSKEYNINQQRSGNKMIFLVQRSY